MHEGWPVQKSMVHDLAKPYYTFKDDITFSNGLLLKGMRIIIPSSLRAEIRSRLHTGHPGIEKTKLRARETVFWPGLDSELTDMISNCPVCIEFQNKQSSEPLIAHEIPSKVWTKLGTDLFELFNKYYLIVVDYTSKYFEISQLPNTEANTVVTHTKSILARHSIHKAMEWSNERYRQSNAL